MLRQLFAASLCMTAVTAFGGGGATGAAPAPTVCPTGGKPDTNSKCTQYARMCTRSSRIITMCPCSCKGKTAAPTKPRSSGGRGSGRSNSTAAKYPKTMHKQCASNHRLKYRGRAAQSSAKLAEYYCGKLKDCQGVYQPGCKGSKFYLCGENTTVAHAPHTAAPSHVVGTHVTHGATCEDAWDQHAASAAMPQDVMTSAASGCVYMKPPKKVSAHTPPAAFKSCAAEILKTSGGCNGGSPADQHLRTGCAKSCNNCNTGGKGGKGGNTGKGGATTTVAAPGAGQD